MMNCRGCLRVANHASKLRLVYYSASQRQFTRSFCTKNSKSQDSKEQEQQIDQNSETEFKGDPFEKFFGAEEIPREHVRSKNERIFALALGNKSRNENQKEIVRKVKQEGEKALGIYTPKPEEKYFQLRGGTKYDLLFTKMVAEKGLTKKAFFAAVDKFKAKDKYRRGHKEFINKAVVYMDDFDLERDIEAYHKILSAYPKGRFHPRRMLDALWPVPHPQMYQALDLLTKMEYYHLRPNQDTHDIIQDVFGRASFPMQKCVRMAYWFDKADEMFPNPYPLDLPKDEMVLGRLALDRMMGKMVEKQKGEITVWKEKSPDTGAFIMSSQTDLQKQKLADLRAGSCVYVEGPFYVWIRKLRRCFFIIRTDIDLEPGQEEIDDQAGVLSTCMTGSEDEELVNEWIEYMQNAHPQLKECTMIFNLRPEIVPPEEADEIVVQSREEVEEGVSTEKPHEYSHI